MYARSYIFTYLYIYIYGVWVSVSVRTEAYEYEFSPGICLDIMKNIRRKFLRNRFFPTVKRNANLCHALKFGELMSTGENEWEEMTDILCRERQEGNRV